MQLNFSEEKKSIKLEINYPKVVEKCIHVVEEKIKKQKQK